MIPIPESESFEALRALREEYLAHEPPEMATAVEVAGNWHLSAASVRGPSHIRSGDPRQDAFGFAFTGETVVACVADGLGSEARSHIGSMIASTHVSRDIATAIEGMSADELAAALAEGAEGALGDVVRGAVSSAAREAEALMQMVPGPGFSTTLVGVVAGPDGGFFFHVGDGAALAYETAPFGEAESASELPVEDAEPETAPTEAEAVTTETPLGEIEAGRDTQREDGAHPVVSPPENGTFDDITYPIDTNPDDQHLRITTFSAASFIVLMTDGPMPFTLERNQDALAAGVFRPLIGHLAGPRGQEIGGRLIAKLLADPRAGEISNDDKTILVLRRIV